MSLLRASTTSCPTETYGSCVPSSYISFGRLKAQCSSQLTCHTTTSQETAYAKTRPFTLAGPRHNHDSVLDSLPPTGSRHGLHLWTDRCRLRCFPYT